MDQVSEIDEEVLLDDSMETSNASINLIIRLE